MQSYNGCLLMWALFINLVCASVGVHLNLLNSNSPDFFFIRFDERAPHKLKGIIDVYNECNKDPIDEIV